MTVESGLDVVVKGRDELTPSLAAIQSKLIRFVGAVSSALATVKIAAFPVDSVREFEKEMAGVQKTTGFTDGQIKNLGDSLINLSRNINVSAADLAKIAAAAGQQGLGKEGVEGVRQFTESVSRMASVLDITVEEAGTNVGKIASIFKIPLKDIENAVSAFNEVSNNSTASGEQLLDVVKRIGDAAGSLNLQQSIGLSATGIDLGLSPEVVGSSFQKVFAEMYARAGQFSKLLGVSVEDWIKGLQTNGIDALKQYLAGLRKLTPEAQQQTIKALSGGGRIGALVTKLLQDTEDTILDTNVANAVRGIETGTSAIKEQQTVLGTLDAQITKAGNSFKALGIIAGEEFGTKLAAYFAKINDGLNNPEVIKFAKAVGQAFLDMFDAIAVGIKYVSDLNITWTNFITVAKILVGIKIAQVLAGFVTGIPLVTAAWNRLTGAAIAAGEAQAQAGGAGAGVLVTQLARLKELQAGRQAYIATLEAERVAIAANAKAQADRDAAEAAHVKAGNRVNNAIGTLTTAGNAVTAAKSGVATAEAQAAAQAQAVQDQRNARLEESQRQHASRMAQITVESNRLQSVARATGSAEDVAAVRAAGEAQLRAEEASQARSIAGINGYYNRRLRVVQEAGAIEVATAKAGLAASLSEFDGVAKTVGLTELRNQSEAAAAGLRTAEAAATGAATQMTLAQRAASVAARGFTLLAVGVRGLGVAFTALIGIASKAFFWLSIIYTILEATGAIETVTKYFQKLTDALGFTSQGARDAAQADKDHAAALEELKKNAADAADAIANLNKVRDQDTGRISAKSTKAFDIGLSSKDRDEYLKTFDTIIKAAEGAQAELDQFQGSKKFTEETVKSLDDAKAPALAKLDELKAAFKKATEDTLDFSITAEPGFNDGGQRALLEAKDALDQQQKVVDNIDKKIASLGDEIGKNLSKGIKDAQGDLETLQKYIQTTFTDESATTFQNFAQPYLDARKQLEEAKAQFTVLDKRSQTAAADGLSEEQQKALKDEVELQRARVGAANKAQEDIKNQLIININELKKTGGLSEATIGSLDALTTFITQSDGVIATILRGIGLVKAAGTGFTGTQAPPPKTASEGQNTFKPLSDSEIRRQRKAQADLIRAGLEADAALQKEYNSQTQDDNEDAYKHNLKSMRDYYDERLRLQRANLDIELTLQRNQVKNLQDELGQINASSDQGKIDEKLKNPKLTDADRKALEAARETAPRDDSDSLRVQAQIRQAQGQVDQLEAQKARLETDNERAYKDAVRNFKDQVTDQKEALIAYLGNGTDQELYAATLEAAQAKYREFVEKLTIESKNMPELLPIIDQIKLQGEFQAVEAVIDQIGKRYSVTTGYLDIAKDKITALGEAGILTIDQTNRLLEKNRLASIAAGEAEVAALQATLDSMVAKQGEIVKTTDAYKNLQLQVDQAAAKIDLLKVQGEKVAADINKSIEGEISSAFKSLYGENAGNFAKALEDFFVGVLHTLADKASESLASTLYNALNSALEDASGGAFKSFGDLLAPIFGGGNPEEATKGIAGTLNTADTLTDTAKDLLGTSPATPLYVQDAASGLAAAGGGGKGFLQNIGDGSNETIVPAKVPDESFFSGVFDGLGDKIKGFGSSLYDGVASVGSSIIGGLGSGIESIIGFLGPIFSSLIAAVTGSGASSGIGAAVGAAGVAAAAHGGGIAGRTTMRRTGLSPFVFQDAVRYHTGGKAGLAPNEVPVILEKGEEVLTREDPRHQDNLSTGGGGDSSGGGTSQFVVQPVLSESAVLDALKGSNGQKTLLVQIGKDPAAFRSALRLKN